MYEEDAFYYESYGLLYNWYAVTDARGLCPGGWHAPTDEEWMGLEMTLGMSEEETNETDWRGTNQGQQMKTDYGGLGNGLTHGFSGLPEASAISMELRLVQLRLLVELVAQWPQCMAVGRRQLQ